MYAFGSCDPKAKEWWDRPSPCCGAEIKIWDDAPCTCAQCGDEVWEDMTQDAEGDWS